MRQEQNDHGTVECRFALSDGSAQYTLVVPASSDGYYEHVRRDGAFYATAELMCRICERGSTVFDFGANVGAVSIPLAARGCNVYAFEILPDNVKLLTKAAGKNPGIKLEVIHLAIWHGHAVLRTAGHSAWGRIDATGDIEVKAISLDDFVRDRCVSSVNAIKLDVEGSELPALKGMSRVLSEYKPDLIFEANALTCGENAYSIYDLFEFLEQCGYSLYRIEEGLLVPCHTGDMQFVITADYLATFQTASTLAGISCQIAPFSAQSLMALLRNEGLKGPEHRKYVALHREVMPRALQSDPELAILLDRWSDEPADECLMSSLRIGCRSDAVHYLAGPLKRV
jgi:FkbM family methyltransferase